MCNTKESKFDKKLRKERQKTREKYLKNWLCDPHVESCSFYREDRPGEADYNVKADVVFNLDIITFEEVYKR
jgi:hypothetical protein